MNLRDYERMRTWLRKRWIWLRLDTALVFIPADLREVTLETWRDHAAWQERQNELWRQGRR